ncbi:MAG TPA: M48 family metalloprotease [Gammaproteobacteria bacterium]|nr:M48 family metalloprotease [Gammaproteobacteria bacterium]
MIPSRFGPAAWLLALAVVPPLGASAAEGVYEPVPLKRQEADALIASADELHEQFVKRSLLVTDPTVTDLVQRVGRSLAPKPGDAYVDYRFFVLRDPSPNAFALPNGRVYIHTGMLARLESEDELAAVLAHEINHTAGHHSIIEYRTQGRRIWINLVVGDLASLLTQLHYSRELEQEADDKAPARMLEAGYDPHAMPVVLERLTQDFEGLNPRIPSVWSTHPDPEQRVASSRAVVAALASHAESGGRRPEDFERAMLPLKKLTVRDYIQDDYPYTAIALSQTMLERHPNDLDVEMLLGDAWKALGARAEFAPEDFTTRDRRRNALRRVFKTREERAAAGLETPEGREAYARNLAQAETVYRGILEADPAYAPARRGLGEVFEARGAHRDAARAYIDYLKLAPDAADRVVVLDRLGRLRDELRQEEGNP